MDRQRPVYRPVVAAVKSAVLVACLAIPGLGAADEELDGRIERSRDLEGTLGRLTEQLEAGAAVEVLGAIEDLADEVAADPRWANLHGLALAATGDHRAAIARFTAGLRIDPSRAELHTNLAVSLVEVGATGRALSEFEQATTLNPRSVDAHLGWGRELLRLRRPGSALEPLARARELAPQDVRVLTTFAEAAAAAGRTESAIEAWRRADSLDPGMRSARRLAELLAPIDPEAAISEYDRCLQYDAEALDCREAAATLDLAAGRPESAVARLRDVASLVSPPALDALYLALWSTEGASGVLALARERPPETGTANGILALAHREGGRAREALKATQRGLELAPDDPRLLVVHGAVLEELGRRREARQAWRRALEIDPDNAEARANLEATGGTESAPK